MGFEKSSISNALKAQVGIIVVNYLFTIVSLILQKPVYESVKSNVNNNKNSNNNN
jgi:hypothetical protein